MHEYNFIFDDRVEYQFGLRHRHTIFAPHIYLEGLAINGAVSKCYIGQHNGVRYDKYTGGGAQLSAMQAHIPPKYWARRVLAVCPDELIACDKLVDQWLNATEALLIAQYSASALRLDGRQDPNHDSDVFLNIQSGSPTSRLLENRKLRQRRSRRKVAVKSGSGGLCIESVFTPEAVDAAINLLAEQRGLKVDAYAEPKTPLGRQARSMAVVALTEQRISVFPNSAKAAKVTGLLETSINASAATNKDSIGAGNLSAHGRYWAVLLDDLVSQLTKDKTAAA